MGSRCGLLQQKIPYQLPPNLTYLNLASNNLSGNLPYSISTMVSLTYLNVSHNVLSLPIKDVFTNLQHLSVLDISFNNLDGDLPKSLGLLSNLSSLYLQNNQMTGAVNLLANLSLTYLNIANNNFSGWIPPEFSSISNLVLGGNSFSESPAPPSPPFTSRFPRRANNSCNHTQEAPPPNTTLGAAYGLPSPGGQSSNKRAAEQIVGTVVGSLSGGIFATLAVIAYYWKAHKHKHVRHKSTMDLSKKHSVVTERATHKVPPEQTLKAPPMASLKPPPSEKVMIESVYRNTGSMRRPIVPIAATSYTVDSLQSASNSFSQDFLIGEGSLGRVYRAEFPNGKVLAVKKIDSSALSLQEEDNFLEAVSNMSHLQHPNITALVGYCAEHGHRLLVYEIIGNGTLHDKLHFADDSSKTLTWNQRVRITLGIARALEYLHEVRLPSVVHRNLKSANVLLDEELYPHLSDCGLAGLALTHEEAILSYT